ncbi:MAG: ankyrin repeat domain-containing protein, partial [Endomicrobia bacterium]|nr:ankyrin repeat domain-containing protein [Endomicrobiia bacterium]
MRRELLDNTDCNVNAKDKNGVTALMRIVQEDTDNAENDLISLLEKGADLGAKDSGGNTALMYAAGNANKAFAKSFADLMFGFGDPLPQTVNNEKKSAMDIAVEQNNEELVKFLLGKM